MIASDRSTQLAPTTQTLVPRSSVHSPLRPVPNRMHTLNDTVQAHPGNVLPKAKTHASPDNATQDCIDPDNATQPPRTRRPDNRAQTKKRRIKNKTVPLRKTTRSRFKFVRDSILRYVTQLRGKYPTRLAIADPTGLCEDEFADFREGATPQWCRDQGCYSGRRSKNQARTWRGCVVDWKVIDGNPTGLKPEKAGDQNPPISKAAAKLVSEVTRPIQEPDWENITHVWMGVHPLFGILREAGFVMGAFEMKKVFDWELASGKALIRAVMGPLTELVRKVKREALPPRDNRKAAHPPPLLSPYQSSVGLDFTIESPKRMSMSARLLRIMQLTAAPEQKGTPSVSRGERDPQNTGRRDYPADAVDDNAHYERASPFWASNNCQDDTTSDDSAKAGRSAKRATRTTTLKTCSILQPGRR
ncbi:unnamed protein product [Phytophthora fragariaefolia]|uniref:Unnamed protein product n=1 Tax=Phytophthora fragariaefolia TaxID=1490495 RepID=A0A9W6WXB6_9STRA|nr:unnamed protein product [Phytophthora fragariaefolia]